MARKKKEDSDVVVKVKPPERWHRTQTAEGWKRSVQKLLQEKQKKSAS